MSIVAIASIGLVLVLILFVFFWMQRTVQVPPDQALIVSGRDRVTQDGKKVGFRVVKGGGTFIWPMIETTDTLSLEVVNVDVRAGRVKTADDGRVDVEAKAQLKIKGDEASIIAAVEHFLGQSTLDIKTILRPVLEKHLRATLADFATEEAVRDFESCAAKVQSMAAPEAGSMGMTILNFTIQHVRASES